MFPTLMQAKGHVNSLYSSPYLSMFLHLTETTVSLTFFVAGLPALYFLGLEEEAVQMCAGQWD